MSLGIGTIQSPKNTSNMIADALRSAIMQGKLEIGQSLRQDEIATEFNVSKIPVREALVQLQGEGLVKLMPGRGAMVSELTFAEVDEIYTMRRALEAIALQKALPLLTTADFSEAEVILERIDSTADRSQWAELNWEFHEILYRPANMPRLIHTTRTLHNNVARYLLLRHLDDDYLAESQRQHRELIDACRAHDAEQAIKVLEHHLDDPARVFSEMKK